MMRSSVPSLASILAASGLEALRGDVEVCLGLESPVLIVGESGTGKTLLATAIAEASGRAPIVRAMLGTSDDLNTIASELFGHERGAFSGAAYARKGLVDLADGGTLILDEVLNLSLHAQQLLLDLTQYGTFRPLGWQERAPKLARVRIVAATNGDLARAVADGRFRRDLYYRLAGTVLRMPPLRERRTDLTELALSALHRIDPSRRWSLTDGARRVLRSPAHEGPGNVRELEMVMARARARAVARDPHCARITEEHFGPRFAAEAPAEVATIDGGAPDESLADAWARVVRERSRLESEERDILEAAVRAHRGVLAHAARDLRMPRTTLISRLARAGISTSQRTREVAPGSENG
jgi:transcriptional regulator with GAF, ATPase, and Fis domain